jgi:hypothetical protein
MSVRPAPRLLQHTAAPMSDEERAYIEAHRRHPHQQWGGMTDAAQKNSQHHHRQKILERCDIEDRIKREKYERQKEEMRAYLQSADRPKSSIVHMGEGDKHMLAELKSRAGVAYDRYVRLISEDMQNSSRKQMYAQCIDCSKTIKDAMTMGGCGYAIEDLKQIIGHLNKSNRNGEYAMESEWWDLYKTPQFTGGMCFTSGLSDDVYYHDRTPLHEPTNFYNGGGDGGERGYYDYGFQDEGAQADYSGLLHTTSGHSSSPHNVHFRGRGGGWKTTCCR